MMYKRIGLIAVGATFLLSMTACGAYSEDPTKELDRRINGVTQQSTEQGSGLIGQQRDGRDEIGVDNNTRNDALINARDIDMQSEQLLQRVRNVNGVNDATLFVNGDDVVVGLDLDSDSDHAQIEQHVKHMLQEANSGFTVHVTSDAEMHDRIRQIKGQMVPMDGHPIRNMAQDITTLLEDMGRVVTEPLR